MPKQLNIRSDEAYERAHRVAKQLGTTTAEAVIRALRNIETDLPQLPTYDDLTPEEKADFAMFKQLAQKARAEATNPGFSEDDLYGDDGLPK
ncbi:MAG: type II toxin-antitoxin system VapB family antitoxin [Bauldia sp.]|nr:type II toxin-antitoxin system VapB family antitoxin [Bauldia sp.]